MNLFGDGSKFGKPVNNIGIRGYVFLARMGPNWNMGFRKEGTNGVGQAGNQNLQNATVTLKYDYCPLTITGQAMALTKGESKAFMQAKALEAKYDMKDMVSHVNVIVAGAYRGGQLALVTAASSGSITVSTGLKSGAALFLRVGQIIDIGPVGGGANSVTAATITAITYATGVVTHNGGVATVGHAVTLSGEAAQVTADFPMTCECFDSLIDDTIKIQGLDPTVANQAAWQSFKSDQGGSTTISSALIQEMRQYVKNRGGEDPDMFFFSSAQINQYVSIATTTLRFDVNMAKAYSQKQALDLGFTVYDYAGKMIVEDKDILPDRFFVGATEFMKKFEAIPLSMAEDEAGEWTRMSGANGIADAVMGLLRWYINLGILQRSAWGKCRNLAVPTDFQTLPPTL